MPKVTKKQTHVQYSISTPSTNQQVPDHGEGIDQAGPPSNYRNHTHHYAIDEKMTISKMAVRQNSNRFFNESAGHLEFRDTLIGWLKKAAHELQYSNVTYHLSVAILDAVFAKCAIEASCIKLVCFTALHLAAKMHENGDKLLSTSQVTDLFKNEFDAEDVLETERLMFKVLDYKVDIQTPYAFLHMLMPHALDTIDESSPHFQLSQNRKAGAKLEELATSLIEIALLDYSFNKFTPMSVAVSALVIARKYLELEPHYPPRLEYYTSLCFSDFDKCCTNLFKISGLTSESKNNVFEKENIYTEEENCLKSSRNMGLMSTANEFVIEESAEDIDLTNNDDRKTHARKKMF